jgi:hypothetical protein
MSNILLIRGKSGPRCSTHCFRPKRREQTRNLRTREPHACSRRSHGVNEH